MIALAHRAQRLLDATRAVDFLAPLVLRLYLAPVFWMAGTNKLGSSIFLVLGLSCSHSFCPDMSCRV